MYVNILVGLIVIGLVYWMLKEFVRSRKSPASVLREEIAERKEREERVAENLKRIRQEAEDRMRPVQKGLEEMVASLPAENRPYLATGGEHGAVELVFLSGTDNAEAAADAGAAQQNVSGKMEAVGGVRVSHRLASFTLDAASDDLKQEFALHERFLIERLGADGEVTASTEHDASEDALRHVAKIIAEYVG